MKPTHNVYVPYTFEKGGEEVKKHTLVGSAWVRTPPKARSSASTCGRVSACPASWCCSKPTTTTDANAAGRPSGGPSLTPQLFGAGLETHSSSRRPRLPPAKRGALLQ